jgi:NitT/TauT family transport system substrate-binding protein
LLLAASLALGAAPLGASAAPDKVVFAWPGPEASTMSPFMFAQDLGFFRDENIDFEMISLDGAGTVIPQMLSGKVFSSLLTLDPLILSKAPGKPNFQFRFVYDAVRNSAWEISVPDESPVRTVKDLQGKTIGVGGLTFGNVPMTKAILKGQGVDPNSVNMVAVGVGAPAFEAFKRKRIDALNLWDVEDGLLAQQGVKLRILPFPSDFQGVTSHSLPVTEKTIREHPDLVARFGRALAEGTVACQANPTGCLTAYFKHYPRPGIPIEDSVKKEMPILQMRLANMTVWNPGQPHKWGAFSDRDFTTNVNSLKVGGLLPANLQINPQTLYSNQFVDQYNRFDPAAVEKRAKAYKP